jgi:hypothetical protein
MRLKSREGRQSFLFECQKTIETLLNQIEGFQKLCKFVAYRNEINGQLSKFVKFSGRRLISISSYLRGMSVRL